MIRLVRLTVHEAPGLPDGVELIGLDPGLNLVQGSNASGKSTLARVLLGTLWPGDTPAAVLAHTVWEEDGRELRAVLRYGDVHWDPERPALPSPGTRHLLSLDLRSLLEASAADADFSRRIMVELMAGYDLDEALDSLRAPTPRSGELQTEFQTARQELRRLEQTAGELARRQDELESLRQRREEARMASELARLADDAARLAGIRAEIGELRAKRDTFPRDLDDLHGGEDGELERLEGTVKAARRRREELTTRQRRAREEAEALSLPGRRPEDHELAAWRERIRQLVETSRTLDELRLQAAGARERLETAARALGSWERPPERLDPTALATLEGALQEREALRSQVTALEAAEALWKAQARTADDAHPGRLEAGLDALRRWLRAAPVERIPAWPGWLAVVFGVATATWYVFPAFPPPPPGSAPWLPPAGALLVGGGAGYLVALALARRAGGGTAEARRRAAEAGVAPTAWEEPAVLERLGRAEEEHARCLQDAEAARRAADARAELAGKRQALEAAEERLRELAASLGLAGDLPGLALTEAANRIRSWVDAHAELAGLRGRISSMEGFLRTGLGELGRWLGELGLAPVNDAASAAARIEELAGRVKDLERLGRELAQLEDDLAAAAAEEADARQTLEAFWKRVGIDPPNPAELRRRLGLLPEYEKLESELRDRLAVAASTEGRLDAEGAWERLGLDRESFTEGQARELADRHAEAAADYESLVAEIKGVEAAIEQAERGSTLEEARTRVADASRAIAGERDRAMETVLAHFLVERARQAQRRDHAPAVLERAQGWFGTFTRGTFRLEVAGDGTFSAVDTGTGASRTLEELSDGTRIHLLLAARLAAIEEAEGTAGPLPLVLDEALATTDPERFAEIAGALLELVREGRQLLYLTANPNEVDLWHRACRRAGLPEPEPSTLPSPPGAAAGWDGVERLDAGAVPEVPPPGDSDAAAWARELGIPAPDPWRPAGAWHVLHLLPDRLETVHRLLQLGFSRVGPLRETLEAGALHQVLDPAERTLLRARACLLETALKLHRQGRGRPVSWADVAASGAVSTTYEQAVKELVETTGREPRAFLDAVRSLRGFRRAKYEELEAYLLAEGILATGESLPDELVALRAAERCHAELQAAGIDAPEAAAYVRAVLSLLEG